MKGEEIDDERDDERDDADEDDEDDDDAAAVATGEVAAFVAAAALDACCCCDDSLSASIWPGLHPSPYDNLTRNGPSGNFFRLEGGGTLDGVGVAVAVAVAESEVVADGDAEGEAVPPAVLTPYVVCNRLCSIAFDGRLIG